MLLTPSAERQLKAKILKGYNDPFYLPGLDFTHETSESMTINQISAGAVIMAGSGMCMGGRIVHHLRNKLGRCKSSVIFVGFAAAGTLGRKIIDEAKTVKIFGGDMTIRARIFTIGGFSVHADQQGLLQWHRRTGSSTTTYIVNGNEQAMEALASQLSYTSVLMPELHRNFNL